MSTTRVFALLSITLLLCGCTRTIRQRAAEYHPGMQPTTQPVPATAVYSIRFLDASGKKFGGIPSSHVFVYKGEPIGFEFDENGKLRGIAGTYSFALDTPADHGLVWSATDRVPTQFSREVARVVEGAGTTAFIVSTGGILFVGFQSGKISLLDLVAR
jgi:hypothetical protein